MRTAIVTGVAFATGFFTVAIGYWQARFLYNAWLHAGF